MLCDKLTKIDKILKDNRIKLVFSVVEYIEILCQSFVPSVALQTVDTVILCDLMGKVII